MRVTLQQIASQVGVDVSAVSRVLNNKADTIRIGRKRIVEIRRVAQDLGYRPNAAARAIRRGQFGCAALIVSDEGEGRSRLSESLLRGLTEALEAEGMHLTLAMLRDEQLTSERFVPKILREWMADGLLVNYNKHIPIRMAELIEEYRFPFVWLNDKRERNAAYPDDLAAGVEATKKLLAMGHRRIAYVTYSYKTDGPHYSELDRRRGYEEAMREAGLTARCVDRYDPPAMEYAERTAVWMDMLARPGRPTAVVAYGQSTLWHVVRAAERIGLGVPGDLSLVTFGEGRASIGQGITTMLLPDAEVGRGAVEMLQHRIAEPTRSMKSRAISFGYDAGSTIAPPAE